VTGPDAALDFAVSLPDIAPFVPQISGPVTLDGTARPTPAGWQIDTSATGPFDVRAAVQGRVTGSAAPDVTFDVTLPDVAPLVPNLSGALNARGRVQVLAEGVTLSTSLTGPLGATAQIDGRATGVDPTLSFSLAVPNIAPLVPTLPGPLNAEGDVLLAAEASPSTRP